MAEASTGPQVLSLFDSKAVLAELKEKGVAVVPNVLTHAQCDEYIDQYKTWFNQFDEAGVEMESRKSLIQAYRIGHFDTTWQVRLKAKPVFAKLWDTEKLLTSADAVAIGKPPEEGGGDFADRDDDWFHLDQGEQRQGLHAFQGAVYLEETTDTDHCFRVLEGSQNYHSDFFKNFPDAGKSTRRFEFYKLNKTQKSWYSKMGCKRMKVPCPKGGIVLWDSRTVHDNCKPEYDRPHKDRWRHVVFVTMTPAIWARPEDLAKKIEAYKKLLITTHWSSQGIKTFKERQVKRFSIDTLPDIAKTEETRKLFGIDMYEFEDGESNGPPEPQWIKSRSSVKQ